MQHAGSFIAGYIDGEACFDIASANARTTFRPVMTIKARDDDAELLEWLRDETGVGQLNALPARATSRPQVSWTVAAREDCESLVGLLDEHRLRTRKARDYGIWREAVKRAGDGRAVTQAALRDLQSDLRATRRFNTAPDVIAALPPWGPQRWSYLAGFVAAEGCLLIDQGRPRLTVRMRADDAPILLTLARDWGYGSVSHSFPAGLRPVVTWTVSALNQVWSMGRNLEPYMRGRKARELAIWNEAIDERVSCVSQGVPADLTSYKSRIEQARQYVERPPRQYAPAKRGRRLKCEPLEALRAWAAEEDGPLTSTAYMQARTQHPEWPARNTFLKRYGTWRGALEAAGLGDRAALSAEAVEQRVRAGDAAREARKVQRRAELVAALRSFEAAHGHLPSSMTEFFAWTRVHAPEAPTQSALYGLFDGGWGGFLAAAA